MNFETLHGLIGGGTIEPPDPPDTYVRPDDWLTLPTVTSGEQKSVALYAIYEQTPYVAVQAQGAYNVDWGDGTNQNVASLTTAYHTYTWADLAGTDCSRGYRQAVVTITPQSGQNIINFTYNTTQSTLTGYTTGVNVLDIRLAGSHIQSLAIRTNCPMLEQFEFIGTNAINNFDTMFRSCYSLQNIVSLDTSNATSFIYMFDSCYSLLSVPLLDTSSGTDFSTMFADCHSLQSVPLLDTSSGNVVGMFAGCSSLKTIPLIDTSSSTSFTSMFSGCSSLKTIPLIDTSSGTGFSNMFNDCYSLQEIPLLDTSSGTNFFSMFAGCYSLETIPLLDTSSGTIFYGMFYYCYLLKTIPLLDTSSGTSFYNMFNSCYLLETIPLLDTSSGTSFYGMFKGCISLQSVPALITSSGTVFGGTNAGMFDGCSNLQSIAITSLSAATNITNIFKNCINLKTITSGLSVSSSLATAVTPFSACYTLNNGLTGAGLAITHTYVNCRLSKQALVDIFTALPTVTSKTITISGNFGASLLTAADRLIATGKGWQISG